MGMGIGKERERCESSQFKGQMCRSGIPLPSESGTNVMRQAGHDLVRGEVMSSRCCFKSPSRDIYVLLPQQTTCRAAGLEFKDESQSEAALRCSC